MKEFIVLATVVLSQCSSIQVHKEWRELSKEEQNGYLTAIKCLREKPSQLAADLPTETFLRPFSRWDDFTYVHGTFGPHGGADFLPWHRGFLALIDRAMKDECEFDGPFPYWDWSIDSEAPERSGVWETFGNKTGCLELPIIGRLDTKVPTEHCTSRQGDMSKSTEFAPEQLALIMSRKNFTSFCNDLESTPHAAVHGGLGGDMGGLQTSPNDPIFYLHHRNVDRFWNLWQKQSAKLFSDYSGERWNKTDFKYEVVTENDDLYYYKIGETMKVKDVFDTKGGAKGLMCYEYSNSITPAKDGGTTNIGKRSDEGIFNTETPSASDRSNLFNIRVPDPLPEEFLKKWHFTDDQIAMVREFEEELKEYTEFINRMPIAFPTSLIQHQIGESRGWVSKSQEQADAEFRLSITLVEAFEAHKA